MTFCVIIITVLKSIFYQLAIFFKGIKMANQTFKVAGITVHNGNAKVRFTDDMVRRVKQFSKGGASRIDLIELPSEMTKLEALAYMQAHADFQSAEDQATISDAIIDRAKVKSEVTVRTSKKAKPSLANIKARGKKQVTAEQVLAEVGVATV
jgi:hypothetical protein